MPKLSKKIQDYFKEGFYKGIAWSFGVTLGFAIVSSLLYFLLKTLGGVPLIGTWIASLVEATQSALYR